jgi:hypothetical protein
VKLEDYSVMVLDRPKDYLEVRRLLRGSWRCMSMKTGARSDLGTAGQEFARG